MDFIKKGSSTLLKNTGFSLTYLQFTLPFQPLYQIRRVPASYPAIIFDPKGPSNLKVHSLITIRVIEGQPEISGLGAERERKRLPMRVGWATYITEKVQVTSAIDILFVTPQPVRRVASIKELLN